MTFNVLLVDDDVPVLQTLKTVFETRDFSVSTATCAKEAIASISDTPFDLVVTDMRMETTTSGYEVVRQAKGKPDSPVVVILSAFPIPSTEWRNSGADAMFMKGGGIGRMLDDLVRMLEHRETHKTSVSAAPKTNKQAQ